MVVSFDSLTQSRITWKGSPSEGLIKLEGVHVFGGGVILSKAVNTRLWGRHHSRGMASRANMRVSIVFYDYGRDVMDSFRLL